MSTPNQDREFIATRHVDLSSNLVRVLEETSEKTRENYLKRFKALCKRASKKSSDSGTMFNILFFQEIKDIEEKRKNAQLKQSSVRQYKGSLMYGLTLASTYSKNQQLVNNLYSTDQAIFLKNISDKLSLENINEYYERISNWQSEDAGVAKRLDNEAHLGANTSSTKTKAFDKALYNHLMAQPDRLDLLKLFVKMNLKLGLRPNEWYSCRLIYRPHFENLMKGKIDPRAAETYGIHNALSVDDKEMVRQSYHFLESLYPDIKPSTDGHASKRPALVVKNAKNTHGRANGGWRYILTDAMSEEDAALLPILITKLHEKHSKQVPTASLRNKENFDELVMQPLQKQFKYWLDTDEKCIDIIEDDFKRRSNLYRNEHKRAIKAGKGQEWKRTPPIRLYPTLYSTRHQAVSDAKASGMSGVVMAALFGHASIVTADRHYGRISSSWGSGIVQPQQNSVDRVLAGLTDNQLEAALEKIEPQILIEAYKTITMENGGLDAAESIDTVNRVAEHSGIEMALDYIANSEGGINQKFTKALKSLSKAEPGSGSQGSVKRKTPKTRI